MRERPKSRDSGAGEKAGSFENEEGGGPRRGGVRGLDCFVGFASSQRRVGRLSLGNGSDHVRVLSFSPAPQYLRLLRLLGVDGG